MKNIVIATVKSWNLANAEILKQKLAGEYVVTIISDKQQLTSERLADLDPEYAFFPHWSWIIPEEIYSAFNCVVFHMTDLPFGRGGSPLQNLIARGIYETKISAIKVVKDLDAGDVYLKKDLNIEFGSAEEIFSRASKVIFTEMIPAILKDKPHPKIQKGEIVKFSRRKPEQSELFTANLNSSKKVYDYIRMLDAEGYPKAYIMLNSIKIEFSGAQFHNGRLTGRFEVINEE
jgi:methionyl-tRNA formyltransferase